MENPEEKSRIDEDLHGRKGTNRIESEKMQRKLQ